MSIYVINIIMVLLSAGIVYWNHLRRCSDQSGSVAGQHDTNLDTGTIWDGAQTNQSGIVTWIMLWL